MASGVADTGGVVGGVGGWGPVLAAAGVGARVGWAEPGRGVGKGSSVKVGAVAGAGWPVAKAGFEGWLKSPASGESGWVVTAGGGDMPGDDGAESWGDAPEPEAPGAVDAGSSAEVSSAWLA